MEGRGEILKTIAGPTPTTAMSTRIRMCRRNCAMNIARDSGVAMSAPLPT